MRGSKTKDSSPADTVSLRKQVSLIQEAPASIGGGSSLPYKVHFLFRIMKINAIKAPAMINH